MSLIVSLISPPGGGKTTVLRAVSNKWRVPVVSSGDIARSFAQDFLARGKFAPEDEMRERLKRAVDELLEKYSVVLADGFPRSVDQYEWMKQAFPHTHIALYFLDVPLDVAKERLRSRGRADDEGVMEARFENYLKYTLPIVEKYNVPKYDYDFVAQSILYFRKSPNRILK